MPTIFGSLADFVTAMTTNITSGALWDELAPIGAFVGLMVLFVFGYTRVRKVIKGASKGKANI